MKKKRKKIRPCNMFGIFVKIVELVLHCGLTFWAKIGIELKTIVETIFSKYFCLAENTRALVHNRMRTYIE